MKVKLINENFKENYLKNLLLHRGVKNLTEFFEPSENNLQDASNLKNIQLGANLYLRVVKNKGRILLVVDSDCDGFTSAAIIYQYTKKLNPDCQIDYWLHEGKQHGLQDHIDKLMTSNINYDLILLPDSSSNDKEYHDQLDSINIPCLVLDHHLTDVPLSDNAIVINNQLSPKYLNKELTGAGVVYQFCKYIDKIENVNYADEYLDLAALGIVGDMGSVLQMENRYIIKKGFSEQYLKNILFKTLLEKQSYSISGKQGASWQDIVKATNPISVAFYIVPLINASIRVASREEKERLFLGFISGDTLVSSNKRGEKGKMVLVADEVARECTNAKNKQNKIKESVVERLEQKIFKYDLLENKVLFVKLDEEDDNFPTVLTGLVAMQLSAKYKKPTIVGRLNSQGFIRGSGRGLSQSELTDFKKFLTDSGIFEYAQGHANAFGFSMHETNLEWFYKYTNDKLKDIDFGENCYDVNFQRNSKDDDITNLVTDLGAAKEVWGQQNNEALIYITQIPVDSSNMRIMGANKDTLKIEYNGIPYLKFHAKDMIEDLQNRGKTVINIVGKANINEWMGRISPQIFIEAYEIDNNLPIGF